MTDECNKDNSFKQIHLGEFVALTALITSLTALSIDAMLPALVDIGRDLGVKRANSNQLVVSLLFAGMVLGQVFYGPLSDQVGRKPAIYVGLSIFIIGCILSMLAKTLPVLLLGRVLQGLGTAGPRIVTTALIRDLYTGRSMAKVMSFVMTFFILVPIVAPFIGQGIMLISHWRAIFGVFLVLAVATTFWFAIRQKETLPVTQRIRFSWTKLTQILPDIFFNKVVLGYTITIGLVMGAFLGYLNSAQQILQVQYELGLRFPLIFAIFALAIGASSFTNGLLVTHYGAQKLTSWALISIAFFSLTSLIIALVLDGKPPLFIFIIYMLLTFFGFGCLFGNLNAMAMEPIGHIAGYGAGIVGSISTAIALLLGIVIGQLYNDTILPLVGGFFVLSVAARLVMEWAERGREMG